MYYLRLAKPDWFFKQSTMGSEWHIAMNGAEVAQAIQEISLGKQVSNAPLRVLTFCGKNLKYGNYSEIGQRDRVRNGCEYCHVAYIPPEDEDERKRLEEERQVYRGDLPF